MFGFGVRPAALFDRLPQSAERNVQPLLQARANAFRLAGPINPERNSRYPRYAKNVPTDSTASRKSTPLLFSILSSLHRKRVCRCAGRQCRGSSPRPISQENRRWRSALLLGGIEVRCGCVFDAGLISEWTAFHPTRRMDSQSAGQESKSMFSLGKESNSMFSLTVIQFCIAGSEALLSLRK